MLRRRYARASRLRLEETKASLLRSLVQAENSGRRWCHPVLYGLERFALARLIAQAYITRVPGRHMSTTAGRTWLAAYDARDDTT